MAQSAGFIYVTTNNVNGKKYVGKSTKPESEEYLGSGKALILAVKKYGKENFTREIIANAFTRADLYDLETHFITEFNASKSQRWYNIAAESNFTGGFKGKLHTPERNKALSEKLTGHLVSEKAREKMRDAWRLRKAQGDLSSYNRPENIERQRKVAAVTGRANAKPKETRSYKCIVCENQFEVTEYSHHGERPEPTCSPKCTGKKVGLKNRGQQRPSLKNNLTRLAKKFCQHCSNYLDPGNYAKHHSVKCSKLQ